MRDRSKQKNDALTELKREVESIKDPENRSISEHMIVVMAALGVGANLDRLVELTGYSREFIEGISFRMRKAGLWEGESVDTRELSDQDSELLRGVFAHALVAQGAVTRVPNVNGGCVYIDSETGEVSGEWSPSESRG